MPLQGHGQSPVKVWSCSAARQMPREEDAAVQENKMTKLLTKWQNMAKPNGQMAKCMYVGTMTSMTVIQNELEEIFVQIVTVTDHFDLHRPMF